MEWSEKNKYNSFSSMKGLTYYENYKAIVRWMDGDPHLPPPIECNLDPIAECNLDCYFCITQRYLNYSRQEVGEMRKLPTPYMYRLVDFLAQWGVRGLCISGGGEPTLHKGSWHLPAYAASKGIKSSFFTNATTINEELADGLLQCQWVAISVDAADRESFKVIKGGDNFNQVIANISYLTNMRRKQNSDTNICFKLLVLPENQDSIHDACKLAREIGVQDFHVRPVDFERTDIKGGKKLDIDVEKVKEQFARCHEEETDDFHVYTVMHKFDPEFHVVHNFTHCLAAPLVIPILTDGNAYLCVDKKMERPFKLGSCYPNPEVILAWWGGTKHRDLIKSVKIEECSRCTWSEYNRQIEDVILEDRMCLAFP